MKTDIILAGVGGQGIVSIAAVLGMSALKNNLCLKQSEVHGMSQRGGAVQSNMRISDKEIASDLIAKGTADIILSVEPMESLRYLPYLKKDGWLVTNSTPFINITDYPDEESLYLEIRKIRNNILIDADKIAKDVNSSRSSNIVMLGAASPFIDIEPSVFEKGIAEIFGRKGEDIVNANVRAFYAGLEFSKSILGG